MAATYSPLLIDPILQSQPSVDFIHPPPVTPPNPPTDIFTPRRCIAGRGILLGDGAL